MRIVVVLILLIVNVSFSDIKSTNGEIKFKTELDNQVDMLLNSTGLGVGTDPSANLHIAGNAIISEKLFIGTNAGTSNLNLNGTLGFSALVVTSDTVLDNQTVVLVDSSSSNIILTLPLASSSSGRIYKVKKTSPLNQLWISSSDNIEGYDGHLEITSPESGYSYTEVISNGEQWYLLNKSDDILNIVAADNLVGWWKFDESSGDLALDSSEDRNHGNLILMDLSTDSVDGEIDGAYEFDGASQYVEASNVVVEKSFTIMIWAKSNGATWNDYGHLLSSRSNNGFLLHPNGGTDDVRTIIYSSTGAQTTVTTISVPDITIWNHYATTYDGDTGDFIMYLNGESINTGNSAITRTSGTATVNLGRDHTWASRLFDGQLDDARIYTKVLTESEIMTIYTKSE